MATIYKVTLQILEDTETQDPLGPEVWGRVWVNDPTDRKAFVQEFGWLGHALREELTRQWKVEMEVAHDVEQPAVLPG